MEKYMSKENILDLAKQAGFELLDTGDGGVIVEDTSDGTAIEKFAALVAANERKLLSNLRAELYADYTRPEGRWGMHGQSAVDDDYFCALKYVIDKMDSILSTDDAPNAEVNGERSESGGLTR